jgi:tRNA modification GTPase
MTNDTIAAVSTPFGEGGIGIVRLSGSDAVCIVDRLFSSRRHKPLRDTPSHRIIHGYIRDPSTGLNIDEVLVSIMRSPLTYTREDVVEINCHGGMAPVRKILEIVLGEGARLAEPGEFTRRAFLNGRIDLSQAEAVLDLIQSRTDESRKIAVAQLEGGLSQKIAALRERLSDICAQSEASIDFPEDEIELSSLQDMLRSMEAVVSELRNLATTYDEARFFRDGLMTAIIGRPNVGKSSLLNSLVRKDRAIVTEFPGTTRDVIEDYLNIKGLPLRIMDTAGIRDVNDVTEREGVRRSLVSLESADLVLALFDSSEPLRRDDFEVMIKISGKNTLIVLNKSDLPAVFDADSLTADYLPLPLPVIKISALRGDGIEDLKKLIFSSCLKNWNESREGIVVNNIRHKRSIDLALESLSRAIAALRENQPAEIVAFEIRDSLDRLGEIAGTVTSEDILNRIFSEFCIGK